MQLTSQAFSYGRPIPKKYSCQGVGISPPLSFSDVPREAKSLVLIVEDPDVPPSVREDGLWIHWIVYNLSPVVSNLAAGAQIFAVQGLNTAGEIGYCPPCPPDAKHRYYFYAYALDVVLSDEEGVTKEQLLEAMDGHIIATAELMGTYEKD